MRTHGIGAAVRSGRRFARPCCNAVRQAFALPAGALCPLANPARSSCGPRVPKSHQAPLAAGSRRHDIMLSALPWFIAACIAATCAWFAAGWFYGKKIAALRAQIKAVKQTAAEHASQARRQVAQLQAEIEARKAAALPPRSAPEPAPRVATGQVQVAAAASGKPVQRFVADADLVAPAGFAHTTIVPRDGFASTEVMA